VKTAGVGPMTDSRDESLRAPPGPRRIAVLLGLVGMFGAMALVGDAMSPLLLERQRLALVALTPRSAYIVAAARDAPLPALLLVSVARLCAADPVHFMIGRATGPALLARARRARGLRRVAHRLPAEAGSLWLVAIVGCPTAKTMLVAGGAGLRAGRVAAANVAGTVARVLVIWAAGRAFPAAGETLAVLTVWIAVPGCIAAACVVVARQRRRLGVVLACRVRARWPRLPDQPAPMAPPLAGDSAAAA